VDVEGAVDVVACPFHSDSFFGSLFAAGKRGTATDLNITETSDRTGHMARAAESPANAGSHFRNVSGHLLALLERLTAGGPADAREIVGDPEFPAEYGAVSVFQTARRRSRSTLS